MQTPAPNRFKAALAAGQRQIGFWLAMSDPYLAEVSATAGFDWLLIDSEHAPNDLRSILAQLQAVAPYRAEPIVRPVNGDPALIKRLLDIGARTLLVPMVDTPEQARELVRAVRYPPHGIRGVGSAVGRASRWSARTDYLHIADDEACLLVQAETVPHCRTSKPSARWRVWTACSSVRPIWRRRWAIAATPATPMCSALSTRPCAPSSRRARPRARSPLIRRWPAITWIWAAPSSPPASTSCCSPTARASWRASSWRRRWRKPFSLFLFLPTRTLT
ncbi:probable n terminus of 2, 4-dihydroxyhept-2-ene-1,7-dioic acid aldolase protein [Ralstonia solanacearum IPO1609]|uniref:Probable n terminus of 2, 4-dihydroxyhept-2-ene-1,7-dioic acid aldolase protein n=1 Tax=Ralstonia solanacearum IPO1609 TaxID=564066 RepID=A0A7U7JD47_RALSL|nr:probable n terminus of 2, 4-dihydroxyhept-2-ene-1,7-dioic acid aldolase protein [Ralstonia solanacearum IPO1609]